jgi:acyl-CoA dehydrogenase
MISAARIVRSLRRRGLCSREIELANPQTSSAAFHDALAWPFFEKRHRELGARIDAWASAHLGDTHADHANVDAICRRLVRELGAAGWLRYGIGGTAYGGHGDTIDTRAVCLLREALARHSGLADFALAMQGLGSGAISLGGNEAQKQRYLPRVASGEAIAAFALTEPDAGSDVAALALSAREDGDFYVLDGEKTWISNGGIADFYVVFARTGEAAGARGISAFIVDADTPGLRIAERLDVIAPHPLARLSFENARVPCTALLGNRGEGFKLAMRTLDIFRTSVAAASLGFARRAMSEGIERAASRKMFGQTLGDFQLTQAKLAQMALTIDSSALLVYRAAWMRDSGKSVTREAALAKWHASEGAQQVIDAAVQLWGGSGVQSGAVVEQLYREIRALRIYEGATEVQQLIVGRDLLKAHAARNA